jgi:general secretion pathway protein D
MVGKTIRYDLRNGYSLAFVDADVKRVVDAVLGSMLGADYSIDPAVEGNITLRTSKPVAQESLIPLLENALASVDAVIVANGSSYRVVPRASARTRASLASAAPGTPPPAGYTSEVITLQNASPREIARLLQQFLGKEIIGGTNPAYNQVIITGTAEEREAARSMIARFDVDTLAGMNFELYRLENVDAGTLGSELQRIFQPPYDIIGSRVRLVPLPRLRALLVIAANRSDLNRIEPWIRRLDAGGSGKRKLYSYAVQNGRARDLARSLQLVLGADVGPDSASSVSEPAKARDIEPASAEPAEGGMTEPSEVIGAQTPLPGAATPLVTPGGAGPRIVPQEDTNALLIYATGEEYDLIREALDKIDRAVPQILIEATLAEVTLTKDLSAGVDWSYVTGNSSFRLGNTSSGAPASIFPGFSYGYIGNSAQVVLNTLQSKTNVRVLSAPKLIVLNNQTATLQVGDQVPIVIQQSQSVAAPGAPVVNTIELRDTGVILKVTPRVNESGAVMLDIAQEVSDVVQTTTSGINSPTIQQRRLTTTVSTRSGQMVALGGLIRDRATRQKQGVPLLSEIPILGAAFGRQSTRGEQTELIILLTPTVMRTPEDLRGIVDELIDQLDSTRPLVERARGKQAGAPRSPR